MSRSRHRHPAEAVGAVVADLLRRNGLEGKCREYMAWQVWGEVVGPQIAARAQPIRIREGVLEVRVDQPVWMQQLQLLKPGILSRLNERLGGPVIRDIFWRRGKIERQEFSPDDEPSLNWAAAALTAEEEAGIEEILKPITDPTLHHSLRHFLTRQAKLDKARKEKGE
jgi:hypothetical protein